MFFTSSQKSRQLKKDLLKTACQDISTFTNSVISSSSRDSFQTCLQIDFLISSTVLLADKTLVDDCKIEQGLQDLREIEEVLEKLEKMDLLASLELLTTST
jgi:hypothetical protein